MALEVTIRTIKRWDSDAVIWQGDATNDRDALVKAVVAKTSLFRANLGGANLGGADLRGANLRGANLRDDFVLPTGETWKQYLAEVVPALLTAGGKALDSFTEHWQCHDWDNCPIAHAFDVKGLESVPILLRPRAAQFVQLFDAKLIPWPLQAT